MRWWSRLVRRVKWFFRGLFMGKGGQSGKSGSSSKLTSSASSSSKKPVATLRPRSQSTRRPPSRWRWLKVTLGVFFLLGLAGAGAVAGLLVYYGLDPDLPKFHNLADYQPKVVTRVVDRNGELLGEIYEERRTVVAREKIPPVMIHAIIDAEDAQFYEHKGLNYVGMLRAFLNDLRPGAHLQGASTITQQLVKTSVIKSNERTLRRKAQEAILARRLEGQLTKDEIVSIYLNEIYFGHQRYGIEEAARFYFGKSIADVNAGEAALLASLPKGPEEISPIKHPERAKERQRYVLSQMLRYAHISKADAEYYASAPIQVVRPPVAVGTAPEFVDVAKSALLDKYGDKDAIAAAQKDHKHLDFFVACPRCAYVGTTVVTTCDATAQKVARDALEHRLEELDDRQGYRKPVAKAHVKSTQLTSAVAKALLEERALHHLYKVMDKPSHDDKQRWIESHTGHALTLGHTIEVVVVDVKTGDKPGLVVDSGGERGFLPVPANVKERYNPKSLPLEKRFAAGDVIVARVEPSLGRTDDNLPLLVPEFGPQASALVLDPQTREVRAMVGGYGFHAGGFNRALVARRQPGSAFKPILYATAFTSGKYTPATVMNDSPQVYEMAGLAPWKPKNAESHEFMGPVRLRVALAKSLNTVASQLVFQLGAEPLAQMARNLGIESKLDVTLALGIGASVVTLAELVNAYTTFATGGQRAPEVLISKIASDATVRPPPEQVITPEIAFLITSVMQSVIDDGTAVWAKGKLHRPAAGKTGTTNSERDAWFIGYTPDLVVGTWVGFDDMRDLGHGEQGARSALPIWVDIVNGILKNAPPRSFNQPAGIMVARIDPASGLLAPPTATNAIDEVFLQGTAPTQLAAEAGLANPDTTPLEQQ